MLDVTPLENDLAAEHDPEQVAASVAKVDALNEAAPRTGIPRYSSVASPEAKHVAMNPEQGAKANRAAYSRTGLPKDLNPRLRSNVKAVISPSPTGVTAGETYMRVTDEGKLSYWLTKFKQEAINRWARLENLNIDTGLRRHLADSSSLAAALFADRSRGVVASAVKHGVPVYENGITKIVDFIDPITGNQLRGLIDVMAPLFSSPYGDISQVAQAYAIAQRSYRLDEKSGKKVPIDKRKRRELEEDILELVDDNGRNIIKDWHARWQAYNSYTIDYMRNTGILTDETAQLWRDYADYYPFYRAAEENLKEGHLPLAQKVFGSLTGTTSIRELKGSEESINMDMLEAISLNLTAAIDMGMKNVAQQRIVRDMVELGLAREFKPGVAADAPTVTFMVNGKKREYMVYDPLIFESMKSLDGDSLVHLVRMSAGRASTVLRETITRDPGFMMVNMLRDTLSAFVTSGSNFTPVVDTLKGYTEETERLERLGVSGGYDYSNDPQNMTKFWEREMARRSENGNTVNMFRRVWDGLGHATTLSDAATRNAVYDDVLARTGNEAEAAFQAMEIINFSRRGRNVLARVLTTSIPFLNARFQGLDVFLRALSGRYSTNRDLNKAQVARSAWVRGTMLASLTGLYWLLVSDDEQYKEQSDEIRDNNWVFPTEMGVPIKIPIPFEVGLMFKTLPETLLRTAHGEGAREAVNTGIKGITSTLEINPLGIQLFAPLIEAGLNHNFFTGREIVPYYISQNVADGFAERADTNQLAKIIGSSMNISPMKVEHVLRGYTGTLGSYVWDAVDIGLRYASGDDKKLMPATQWYQYPVIKRFFASPEGSGLKQDFYDLYFEVNKVKGTINNLKKDGRIDELVAYLAGREHLMAMAPMTNRIKEYLERLTRNRQMVLNSDLAPQVKHDMIQDIDAETNALLAVPIPDLKAAADLPPQLPVFNRLYKEGGP
jgi:hypothetical protein